ncbi:MAG TPA: NADH-quinone oxidoreductase subunit NuoF, partial [Candidatus Aminicenantes bacterium]|nr:NADH-quinone oxidoreductase subunit NuoF [Candidatus Aminicenantes bacterium]
THILVPIDEGTVQAGAFSVKRTLLAELQRRGLSGEVKVLETGTVGVVGRGVLLVVYPERVCYTHVREGDITALVEEHLMKGRIVQGLTHIPADFGRGAAGLHDVGLTRTQNRIVLDRGWQVDPENIEEVLAAGGYVALEKVLAEKLTPEAVIDTVKKAGLRGRGGAGFPTGLKWEFTRKAPGEEKYVICNADEGEPGTFKDRLILEGDPHRLVEAMILAGYAIGAARGYVYIRGEYKLSIERMQKAIDQAKRVGLLGADILETGFAFELEIKKGAGAYVCGEETALIESLEGGRGNPRVKPPYPVVAGLWQKPTCVNNVETLANVPGILLHGTDWFRSFGTAKCPGTKVFTILGQVEFPGLVEVAMGTPLREVIFQYGGGMKGGRKFKAALLGGAAGVFLPEQMLDTPMDFDSLKEHRAVLGSGAILVMDEEASVPDMLFSILRFFAHESCGQCAPCRIGSKQLLDMIYDLRQGRGRERDLDLMITVAEAMFQASLCPLGQSPVMPVKSAIEHFRNEFVAAISKIN